MIILASGISSLSSAIAINIFVLLLVFWRKRFGIGWISLGGVVIAIALNLLSFSDILSTLQTLTPSLVTVISLLIIAETLELAGFFRIIAPLVTLLGFGRSRWLFTIVILIAAVISALFSNYTTVLFWTPAVIETLRRLKFPPKVTLAYVLGIGFIANGGSLLFPNSNNLNIITLNLFEISWLRYSLVIIPTQIVIILVSLAVMLFYFDLCFPEKYRWRNRPVQMRDPLICRWGFPIIGLLLLSFTFAQPPAVFIFLTAFITLAIAGRWYTLNSTNTLPILKIIKQIPWQLLLFSINIYLLSTALANTGIIYYLSQLFSILSSWGLTLAVMGTGFLATILSSFGQDLPTLMNNAIALQKVTFPQEITNPRLIHEGMIYSNLIGCTIGAKISPIGSLATLLWLNIINKKILHLHWRQYFQIHLALVLPVLFFSLLFLAIWLPWLYA